MKHNGCTCIIPFYNEQEGVVGVVRKLATIKHFDEIILVNDGSQDNSLALVQNFVSNHKKKHIHIISYKRNRGKTYAIHQGLKKVKTKYVCMFDSDLKKINTKEIIYMIKHMLQHTEIDMGIMRRIHAKRYIKLLYRELILSGQRMLKTKDLTEIYRKDFEKYQLEVAINTFMEQKKKTVVRYPFTGKNTFKSKKRGILTGIKKDISMFRDIFKYQGLVGYIRHSFSFCPIDEKKYKGKKEKI